MTPSLEVIFDYMRVVPLGLMDNWASHGAELVFVFNNTQFNGPLDGKPIHCLFTEGERQLSSKMQSLWHDIAATSNPSPTDWPQFSNTDNVDGKTLRLSLPSSQALGGLKQVDCAFWDALELGNI